MKPIFYPGNQGQPCRADYGIVRRSNGSYTTEALIIVIWKRWPSGGTSLFSAYDGVDSILNRILSSDLMDVRIDCIRMVLVQDLKDEVGEADYGPLDAIEVPIRFSPREWIERWRRPGLLERLGDLFRRRSAWQVFEREVVAGSIRCWTDRERFRSLEQDELDTLLDAVGYQIKLKVPARRAGAAAAAAC